MMTLSDSTPVRRGLLSLAEAFAVPPREHSVRPFWFWNDELDDRETARQIDAMQEQGVHGAYLDCRSGLRPRYLSEDWWRLVQSTAAHAQSVGFLLGASDEYNWPAGEARDWTLPGVPSRVLHERPDLRMTRLQFTRQTVPAGGRVEGGTDDFAVLAELDDHELIDPESLRVIEHPTTSARRGTRYGFRLVPAVGFDGGLVDLLDPATAEIYTSLVYEQYRHQLGDLFGTAFFGFFVDHEGDYGRRLAWSGGLERALAAHSGRDFRALPPLLLDDLDGPGIAARSAYLEVVSRLYADNFFGRLSQWCRDNGVSLTAHTWEENLHASAAFQGDFYAIQRALETPGVDSLFTWGDHPRHLLEAASVAHERRSRLVVENQGVQGADSYLSPDVLKGPTAALAIWGATDFVPHAFHGSARRMEFPEDWFEAQPWWVAFSSYADLAARLSLVGSAARKLSSVLMLHPRESAWALSAPVFDESRWDYGYAGFDLERGSVIAFGNDLDGIEEQYGAVMEELALAGCDVIVADETGLAAATVDSDLDGAYVEIAGDRYRTIVITHVRSMHRAALRAIVDFAERGGVVFSTGSLPAASVEAGGGDAEVSSAVTRLRAASGFRPLTILETVDEVLARTPSDVVIRRSADLLRSTRALADGTRMHLLLNRSPHARSERLLLQGDQPAELWRFETGERTRLPSEDGRTVLELGPHEIVAVVRADSGARDRRAPDGPFETIAVLDSGWTLTLDSAEVPIPWAPASAAEAVGAAQLRDAPLVRLEADERVLRRWWIIGPYDYGMHTGYDVPHPPEVDPDEQAVYSSGPPAWTPWVAPDRFVDCGRALGLESPQWIIERATTAYATTVVDVAEDADAELRIVADANAKVWIDGRLVLADRDDHHGYLEYHDGFATRVPIRLTAGRHRVLVKVSQGVRMGGALGFVARMCDGRGAPIAGLREVGPGSPDVLQPLWAALAVPAGSHTLHAPGVDRALVDGIETPIRKDVVEMPPDAEWAVVRWPADGGPAGGVLFETSTAPTVLGSLTETPARWWAGRAVYRTEVDLPAGIPAATRLDLGDVGVVARVTVNGLRLQMLPWAPYSVTIGGTLQPGRNLIEVEVWNTNSHRRAGQPHAEAFPGSPSHGPALLDRLHRNGLLGPVRILVPSERL